MKRALLLALALGGSCLLASCAGIQAMGSRAYVDSIPAVLSGLAAKADGLYRGSYTIGLPAGAFAVFRHVEVDVAVASGAITRIDLIEPEIMRTADFFLELPGRIVAAQSLDVDGVSSVTYTSKAFIKAVEDAVRN